MRDSASGFRTQAECTARNGENAFPFPLKVTSDGIVMDEYAHLENCAIAGRTIVECIEWNISFEEEALRRLRLCHRPSPRLAPFSRIIMARDLTKSLEQKRCSTSRRTDEESELQSAKLIQNFFVPPI
jgi:hypothetical protein